MKRIATVVVSNCFECPFLIRDGEDGIHGKLVCKTTGKVIPTDVNQKDYIDADCPLPINS